MYKKTMKYKLNKMNENVEETFNEDSNENVYNLDRYPDANSMSPD